MRKFQLAVWLSIYNFYSHFTKVTRKCECFGRIVMPCKYGNHINGVVVSVPASSVVDRGFDPWLSETKDYNIGICCFSAKHPALRRKGRDWLASES